ncbi:hypothetical protein C4D60_Mb02t23360 [Musa balbisiana]|uniref:Uncharacterized protein n=1 Tax=Musa balbisiana TaxID=52838 RepID=A0A4S8ICX0_MUSBA|nr:hypothetical protein C4D60_Mb02t23360 [Musa balbisiana]
MNDCSHPPALLRVIALEAPGEPVSHSCHGRTPKGESLMCLLHVCTFVGFLLLLPTTDVCYSDDEELAGSIFGREEGLFFFYNESIFDDTLLVEEEQDSSDQEHHSKVDESFATESPHSSPLEDQSNPGLENDDSPVSDVIRTSSSPPPIICGSVEGTSGNATLPCRRTIINSNLSHYLIMRMLITDEDCVGDAFHNNEKEEEEEQNEESSKKQKLLIYQPKSVSRRIVHKFTTHKKKKKGNRDPYQELESAYVAQICLAWEALNWNYNHFRQWSAKGSNSERASCTAWMAQQFQQFQVLLQRFIENEPYERGRRPQVFARTRISSPKLLLVPEFRDSEADEGKEEMITSTEFSAILEDAIRTFMNFLKADKENPCQMLKAFIKRKSSSVDPNLRHMKIVSRTLRMHEISHEQLHWCEEKMTKVRVCDGKIQRDSSPLFFPVQ